MARQVAVVPHTHWDREWYAPFQTFRLRLVELLDELLPRLDVDPSDGDPSGEQFLLDGQMAVVDDYLEVRPEAEPVLRRLGRSGRLAMGPWYALMDEFCVSGETIVRNLQMGLRRAKDFGDAMPVGYLPDMFGHVAQMPQLLRQAGLSHAVVWRGVPAAVDRTGFWWRAPDGSTVRAEYLPFGYGNGASVPPEAPALVRRVAAHEAELAPFLLDGILFMNGGDHQPPQPWLRQVVSEANASQDDYRLVVTSLVEYLASAPVQGLPTWTGELRSGARANLLMGVLSNRVDVKQAAARAERALERLAEPLCALFLPPGRWPASLLDLAWREVVRNSAHDSVCACSADEVGAAVLHRYAEARQVAEGLSARALAALGASLADPGPVVVNPAARPRGGLVELVLPGEGPTPGVQVLEARPAELVEHTLPASELGVVLGQLQGQRLDEATFVNRVEVDEGEGLLDFVLHGEGLLRESPGVEEATRELSARAGALPDARVRARVARSASRRVLARVDAVPGFGWVALTAPSAADEAAGPVRVIGDEGTDVAWEPRGAGSGLLTLANGLVRVGVDPATATFSIDRMSGLGRLVDSGDHGDTYNYSPPEHDQVVDRPERATARATELGPLRARIELQATYHWPERVDEGRRARVGRREVAVTTVVELRVGERLVRVSTRFDNPCRDHRLRAWFPLPSPATASAAECAFAVVERGLEAEGGPVEAPLPTFPSRRFVRAGGLTVVHEGLLEYELVDSGRALALTLLRATGMLSRARMANRSLPAGPLVPLEGPQMLGPRQADYAVAVDPPSGPLDPYALADDAFLPLLMVHSPGGGSRGPRGSALEVHGAQVSAVRREGEDLEVRVFNPHDRPTQVSFGGRPGWLVDLRGRRVEAFAGRFSLGPWAIATARLPAQ